MCVYMCVCVCVCVCGIDSKLSNVCASALQFCKNNNDSFSFSVVFFKTNVFAPGLALVSVATRIFDVIL